jgi:hypothetical protein
MRAWPKRAQGLIAARGQLQGPRIPSIIAPQVIMWRKNLEILISSRLSYQSEDILLYLCCE